MCEREQVSSEGKHAYLIMAHKDDLTFRTLLRLLDDSRNDIFVHMDAKNSEWDELMMGSLVSRAALYVVPRIGVVWGCYSQIECELGLLRYATGKGHYAFYHLLSGEDLPIKTQNQIHGFFDQYVGTEFVRYDYPPVEARERVHGHWLWNRFATDRSQQRLLRLDLRLSKLAQRFMFRDEGCVYRKGDNWFSISDDFARYIVSKGAWVEKKFRYSFTADEVFLQTLLWNSPFRDRVYCQLGEENEDAIQRLIDWSRGNGSSPHIFTYDDFDMLRDSPLMFARKFDCKEDAQIIKAVEEMVLRGE